MTGEAQERVSASPVDDQRDEPAEQPDQNRTEMVSSLHLMAGKGWLVERKLQAMNDFLRARDLYADFNNFIRRMK